MFQAGVYTRASREDGDRAESETLANQRELILNFLEKTDDIEVFDFYNDDNYTGTNFNRPAFQRMMADAYAGKINCIIVKDLSRLGRNYIDVGNYIQRIFPKHKIRFIAINDHVDTYKQQGYDMLVPFKNIFNEQYARDISTKVISAVRNKQRSGKFIGSFAPYGYKRDPNDKYKFIIDPCAAETVKMIYLMFNEGMGKIAIAKKLNDEGIMCPSEYKKASGLKYHNCNKLDKTFYWTYSTINNILKNQVYAGDMIQHKANESKFDYSNRVVDKSEWLIAKNTHEAIIPRTMWEKTQDLLKRRGRTLSVTNVVSPFAGFLICGDCGRAMSKIQRDGKSHYVCGTYKNCSTQICTRHEIQYKTLEEIVLADINLILSKVDNLKSMIEERERDIAETAVPTKGAQLKGLEIQRDKLMARKKSLYDDYKEGLLTKEEYISFRSEYENKLDDINKLILNLTTPQEGCLSDKENSFIEQLKNTSEVTEISRIVLSTFYDKIVIYEGKKIEFRYKHAQFINHLKNI